MIDNISEEEWRNLKNILDEIDYDILEENCHKTLININLKEQCPSIIKVKNISIIKDIFLKKNFTYGVNLKMR